MTKMVKITKSYEDNVKAISSVEIPVLKEALEGLRKLDHSSSPIPEDKAHPDSHLLKEGLIWELMETLQRLLPYKCKCGLVVGNSNCDVRCRTCSIKACHYCYSGDMDDITYLCGVCDSLLSKLVAIPSSMLTSRYKKKLKSPLDVFNC